MNSLELTAVILVAAELVLVLVGGILCQHDLDAAGKIIMAIGGLSWTASFIINFMVGPNSLFKWVEALISHQETGYDPFGMIIVWVLLLIASFLISGYIAADR